MRKDQRCLLLVVTFLLCGSILQPQFLQLTAFPVENTSVWEKRIDFIEEDWPNSIVQTLDGGFAIVGHSGNSIDGYFISFVKTDQNGDVSWNRSYGVRGSNDATAVLQTDDGNFIIAGHTAPLHFPESDMYLMKISITGSQIWEKTFRSEGYDRKAFSLIQTTDGGYALAGYSGLDRGPWNDDMCLIKTNSRGDLQWEQTYGGNETEWAKSLIQTTDGGYVLAGRSLSFTYYDCHYLVKTDENGNLLWDKNFGGTTDTDNTYTVLQTADRGYVLGGKTGSYTSGHDKVWIGKTDNTGELLWYKTYGERLSHAYSMIRTNDDGFILAGMTYSITYGENDHSDIYVVKVDESGIFQWERAFRFPYTDIAQDIIQTDDGGYVLVGLTGRRGPEGADIYLNKFMGVTPLSTYTSSEPIRNISSIHGIDYFSAIIAILITILQYRRRKN